MNFLRSAWRPALVLAVLVGVGWWAKTAVVRMAAANAPAAQVRLSSWMAGMFGGGAAALVVALLLLAGRRRDV